MPVLLAGMLAVIVAAALTPNTGVVSAQSNCQYASCSQSQEPSVPLDYILIGIIVVETGLLVAAAVLFKRRAAPDGKVEPPVKPSP